MWRGRSGSFIGRCRSSLCLGFEERPEHVGLFGMHSLKLCFVVLLLLELGFTSTGHQHDSGIAETNSRLLFGFFCLSRFSLFLLDSGSFFLRISPAPLLMTYLFWGHFRLFSWRGASSRFIGRRCSLSTSSGDRDTG